jgi:hypothetical protein
MNPCQEATERMQVSLSFDALDEDREAQFDTRVAEVYQPGAASRFSAQCFAVKRAKSVTGRVATPGPKGSLINELLMDR